MVEKFAKKAEDIIVEKMTSRDKEERDSERRQRKVTGVFDLIRYCTAMCTLRNVCVYSCSIVLGYIKGVL